VIPKYLFGVLPIALLSLVLAGCKGARPTDYLPLKLANEWRYRLNDYGDSSDVSVRVVEKAGDKYVLEEGIVFGECEMEFPFVADDANLVAVSDSAVILENPLPLVLLSLPLDVGKSWSTSGSDSATVLGKVAVSVIAGEFENCYKVVYDFRSSGYAYDYVLWYAPAVGVVKTYEGNEFGSYIWELVSTSF
jgi:hypothetical protein